MKKKAENTEKKQPMAGLTEPRRVREALVPTEHLRQLLTFRWSAAPSKRAEG